MQKILFLLGAVISLPVLVANETCEFSRWGEGDEIGNANLINAESILKASQLIKTGKAYSLGVIIDQNTPAYPPRSLSLQVVQPTGQFGKDQFPNATYNDDVFQGWFGIGPQIDGLGHIGDPDAVFYNCFDGKEISQITGLTNLGIEKIPPIVARGLLINIAAVKKVDHLKAGETFDLRDVKKALRAQNISVESGDVVIFHTGWTQHKYDSNPQEWGLGAPGITPEVASYLAEKEVVAVGADTWSLDVVPPIKANEPYPGHGILIQENGIYILETMNTGELADDNVSEFLFVLGPAKVRGAVQMIINPIAIN